MSCFPFTSLPDRVADTVLPFGKTITGISTSEKVPSPKASSRLKSKDVILVHKRVAVLRRSEPKYKNRVSKPSSAAHQSIRMCG